MSDWGHERNSIEEEGTKQEHEVESGECNNDAHTNVWLRGMVPVKAVTIQSTSHSDECLEADRRSK